MQAFQIATDYPMLTQLPFWYSDRCKQIARLKMSNIKLTS
jgi:hypothetical protein